MSVDHRLVGIYGHTPLCNPMNHIYTFTANAETVKAAKKPLSGSGRILPQGAKHQFTSPQVLRMLGIELAEQVASWVQHCHRLLIDDNESSGTLIMVTNLSLAPSVTSFSLLQTACRKELKKFRAIASRADDQGKTFHWTTPLPTNTRFMREPNEESTTISAGELCIAFGGTVLRYERHISSPMGRKSISKKLIFERVEEHGTESYTFNGSHLLRLFTTCTIST